MRMEPSTARSKLKSNALNDCAMGALLMSSATVIVRSGGLFWLKPVAMVLFMLCSIVLVEWFL